ncbi:MAG: hypothetical protein ACRDSS_03595 [Actinocrinis sp.]
MLSLSLPSRIRLRVAQFDKVCRTAGHRTLADQAAHVGLTIGALSKIKNGKSGPDGYSIGAILTGCPDWTFEELFEVVTGETSETGIAA